MRRGFAWAGLLLAAVAVLVVLVPIVVQITGLGGRAGPKPGEPPGELAEAFRNAATPSLGLLLSSLAYAACIGVLATLLALPAAWHARTRGPGALAPMLVPLACPTYLAYAGLNLLRSPGTVVGDWLERAAAHAEWIPLLAGRVLAVVGLAMWAWPLAMLALLPTLRRVDDALLETMQLDGLSRPRRAGFVLAISRDGVVLAVTLVALLMLGSAVPLHLAQAPTYAVEVWATLAQRPGSMLGWVQAWPLAGVAVLGGVVIARRVTRAMEGGWDYDDGGAPGAIRARDPRAWGRHAGGRRVQGFRSSASAYRPRAGTFRAESGDDPPPDEPGARRAASRHPPRAAWGGTRLSTWMSAVVWGVSVLLPLVLFALHLNTWASIPEFLTRELWAILESLRTGAVVGFSMGVLAILAWAAVAHRRGATLPRAVAFATALLGVGALLPGVLMGSGVARAGQALGALLPGDAARGLLDAGLPAIAHIGRFGLIALLAGVWLAASRSAALRDLSRLEGAGGMRSVFEFALRPHLGMFVSVAAGGLLLSLQEIESTTIVLPPGPGCLAHTILAYLHFAREEQMCAAGVVLLGGGTLVASLGAWWVGRRLPR